jgi:hypothetical protein
VSLNPYASGEAALPATEVVPRAPKVAIASAVFAALSILCAVASVVIAYRFRMATEVPSASQGLVGSFLVLGVALFALVGLLLGVVALFIRNRPRLVAYLSTFVNGSIVLGMAALFVLSYRAFGGLD